MIDGHMKSLSESAVDGESRIAQKAGFSPVAQVANVMFLLTAMGCEVIASRLPIYVPLLVAALFAQYVADSALRTGRPIASRVGHWCGIVNYAIVLLLSTGLASASAAVMRVSPILAAFYIIAMAERAWLYYEPRS